MLDEDGAASAAEEESKHTLTIHKQVIPLTSTQKVKLPVGASILDFQIQNGQLCMFYELSREVRDNVECELLMLKTGDTYSQKLRARLKYVRTVRFGSNNWHIFVVFPEKMIKIH